VAAPSRNIPVPLKARGAKREPGRAKHQERGGSFKLQKQFLLSDYSFRRALAYLFLPEATSTPVSLARSIDDLMKPDARTSATNFSIAARSVPAGARVARGDWAAAGTVSRQVRRKVVA